MGLFTGTTSNAGEVSKMDNTPASSSTGGNNKQSNNAGDSAMSKGSDSSKPSTTSKTAAENDPYEFMSGSSKEPTPDKVTDTGKQVKGILLITGLQIYEFFIQISVAFKVSWSKL